MEGLWVYLGLGAPSARDSHWHYVRAGEQNRLRRQFFFFNLEDVTFFPSSQPHPQSQWVPVNSGRLLLRPS